MTVCAYASLWRQYKWKRPAMPIEEGSRGNDGQRAATIEPPAQPQQGQTRWMGDPAGLDSALLIKCELFAQEEILGRERVFGSHSKQQEAGQIGEQVQPE